MGACVAFSGPDVLVVAGLDVDFLPCDFISFSYSGKEKAIHKHVHTVSNASRISKVELDPMVLKNRDSMELVNYD